MTIDGFQFGMQLVCCNFVSCCILELQVSSCCVDSAVLGIGKLSVSHTCRACQLGACVPPRKSFSAAKAGFFFGPGRVLLWSGKNSSAARHKFFCGPEEGPQEQKSI